MTIQALLIWLCCVLVSIKGERIAGREKQDCVESCKEGSQERLGDHCYYWSTARKSWDDSESHCNGEDGHLAAVTSLEIQNFLLQKVKAENAHTWYWIGGTDKGQEGNWEWVDGSAWNFTIWADQPFKQPNNRMSQDCLQIYNHFYAQNGWNDHYCNHAYPFICSWKICQALTTLPPNTTETIPGSPDDDTGDNINEPATTTNVTTNVFHIMGVKVPFLAAVLIPPGALVIIMLITMVTCIACKRSKKKKKTKEEDEDVMDVDENQIYRTYELGENYERQYSINEVIDHNPYYAYNE